MSKEIKIALCGVRGHIDKFGRMINSYPESEAVAVWDPDYDTAKRVADIVGNCAVYTDFDELLRHPGLTGVVITYHNYTHKELVLKAAKAGKNIFLEKPLCTKVEDAYEMRDAIKAAGVKFFLTDPFVNAAQVYMRDFIASGKLGDVITVRVRHANNGNVFTNNTEDYYEFDGRVQCGGHVSDTGGHPMHIMHYLMGKPERLYAKLTYGNEAARKHNYEQYEVLLMDYPGEATGIIEGGLISASYSNACEICGTKGIIVQSPLGDRSSTVRYRLTEITDEDIASGNMREAMSRGDWVTAELPPDPDDHIRYFVKMQAYDIPNEQVGVDPASLHGMNIDAAVDLVEMIDAAYRSAKSGAAEKVGK